MISMAKRIEELREQKNMSRVQLSAALGLPKMSVEKFETGRLTPTKQQQEKIAAFFGVSVDYLTGASDDSTTMASWLADEGPRVETHHPIPKAKPKQENNAPANGDNLFAAFLKSDAFKQAVIEVLKTPEGKELIRKACGK